MRLDGRVIGGFVAWTPSSREVDDTDRSVLAILAGQTAAALQNCALLDHSARLLSRSTRQADVLARRNAELQVTQAELGAARQREVLDSERHRIARELHDSVTQYAGGPVPLPPECEQSLFRIAGEALFNTSVHADASRAVVRLAYGGGRIRLTISDDGSGRPEEVRRNLRAASVACPSGEHRGLVNVAARARELGGTLTFRRARLGGLQVQVDIPTPGAAGTGAAGR